MQSWIKSALLGAFLVCAAGGGAFGAYSLRQMSLEYRPRTVRILNDDGGFIYNYVSTYTKSRRRGDRYIIDGYCVSACTFIMGLIPLDRICITPYARFAFHAAFDVDDKDVRHFNEDGTTQMWLSFPALIQDKLKKAGWSGPKKDQPTLIWLGFDDLKQLYRVCGPKEL